MSPTDGPPVAPVHPPRKIEFDPAARRITVGPGVMMGMINQVTTAVAVNTEPPGLPLIAIAGLCLLLLSLHLILSVLRICIVTIIQYNIEGTYNELTAASIIT